jgi:MFS family permease
MLTLPKPALHASHKSLFAHFVIVVGPEKEPFILSLRYYPLVTTSMGILAKIEDRPTPAAVYNWRVYLSAIVASFGSCMIGYTTSFIGTTVALGSFGDAFGFQDMSTAESTLIKANVVSLFQAGAFFGSPMAYATCHYYGRVKSLWITSSVFLVGAAITFGSITGSLGPLYAGRVICGLGVGGCTMVVSYGSILAFGYLWSVSC